MPKEPAEFSTKYETIRTLGRGCFAVVKEVVNIKTGRRYACKIMPKEGSGCMLRKESVILRRISSGHKSVLNIVDYFETADSSYLVADLAEGGSLSNYIYQKDSYNERDIARIIETVCDGVSYLHDNDVVHRDIKPDNILLRHKDNGIDLLISDFGLSKILDASNLQELHSFCGTPYYMAPEIIKNTGYGKPVDLWAIGVMTYHLLASYPPFASDNSWKERKIIINAKYNYDDAIWNKISEEAKDFIDRCLTIDLNKRITAKEALNHKWFKKICSSDLNTRLPNLRSSFVPRHQMLLKSEKGLFALTTIILAVGVIALAAFYIYKTSRK